jgi:nitrite reductase/ring-hydroxylating ferredoxin subunit/uncharacterized membrane protein
MSDPAGPAHALMERINAAAVLDAPARKVAANVRAKAAPGPLKDLVSGTWLGHALHPMLTDVVIGTWTSALLLDLAGGRGAQGAADRLLAAGLLAYPPTAVTGMTDWADAEPADAGIRRVGALHATVNSTALTLQAASLLARRRGARGRGVALSGAANAVLAFGGWLGGHMSLAQGVGVDQTTFDPGPSEWTTALPAAELRDGEPFAVQVGDTPVLLVRTAAGLRAVHDRCSHRGCSLADGRIDGDVVECVCHGSRFRLADGGIERGPATGPQPAFEVREREGRVEIKLRPRGGAG